MRLVAVWMSAFASAAICGSGAVTAAGLAPDSILDNGRFVTNDPRTPVAAAIGISDGRIVAVGSSADVRALAGSATHVMDLGGRTVLPGFYDNHVHIGVGESDWRSMDWRQIDSKQALLAALAARARMVPKGEWILASLKNENMPQDRLPTRWEMDAVTPDHPVSLHRGHVTLANSLAMKLADITDATPAPEGGEIDRNEKGQAIGWFREGAGRRMVLKAVPPAPPVPSDVAEQEIEARLKRLLPLGITSLNIAGMRPAELGWLQSVYQKHGAWLPRSTVQLRLYPGYDEHDDALEGARISIREMESLAVRTGFGNDRLKLGAIKVSIDGGFSAAAFLTLEPYPSREKPYFGVKRIPRDALYMLARRAHELGWQLGIHAIGDGAVKMVADVYDQILTELPRADHRHYMHHFSVLPPEDVLRTLARHGVLVASQPNFTYSLGPYNASPALTAARLATNNPQQSLRRHGLRVSYGSDGMPLGPLVGIYSAVTRKGVDGKIYGPDEKVGVEDAIRNYTLESAYLTFDEKERGSIEAGKLADLVVLGQDLLSVDHGSIMDVQIDMTMVGGKVLYTRTEEVVPRNLR